MLLIINFVSYQVSALLKTAFVDLSTTIVPTVLDGVCIQALLHQQRQAQSTTTLLTLRKV